MAYTGYDCLRIDLDRGVATVTIDHPPINLFDLALIQEMDRVGRELEADGDVRVAVFQSANPEFFIAHADVALIQTLPTTVPPKATRLGLFHAMVDRFRTMPKATIGKVEGRARGGGERVPALARHALRRARARHPGTARGGAGDHPRRQRHAAAPAPRGTEPRARDRPRLRGFSRRGGGALRLPEPRAARRRARPLRRAPRAPDRVLPGRGDRAREGLHRQ